MALGWGYVAGLSGPLWLWTRSIEAGADVHTFTSTCL